MKQFKLFILTQFIVMAFASCSTTEKFSVKAPNRTRLYAPNDYTIPAGVSGDYTPVNIKLPSNMYCGYMVAKSDSYPEPIPFGIDYKKNTHFGTQFIYNAGYILALAGATAEIAGLAGMLGADEDDEDDEEFSSTMTWVAVGGIGTMCIGGLGMFTPGYYRMRQTAYDYNFGYEKKQVFIMPKLSTMLLHPNPTKEELANSVSAKSTERKKASSGTTTYSKQISRGSKAKKMRSDLARKVEGVYNGTGELLLHGKTDESYANISLIIERIDKNHASIRILENNEDFFDSPLTYLISAGANGSYILIIDNIPDATITITKAGNAIFKHAKVNIDGQLYTLKINASKYK